MLPNNDITKLKIYQNEYVNTSTINRSTIRLLENDSYLDNELSGKASLIDFDNHVNDNSIHKPSNGITLYAEELKKEIGLSSVGIKYFTATSEWKFSNDGINWTPFNLNSNEYVGCVFSFPFSSPPTGFLECNGASLLRSTYSDLFNKIGTTYGNVDGTHFNIPDYRGQFLRGWSHGSTTDPDRATRTDRGDGTTGDNVGTKQSDKYKSHQHNLLTQSTTGGLIQYPIDIDGSVYGEYKTSNTNGIDAIQASGGNETRPTNINVMYCIKY